MATSKTRFYDLSAVFIGAVSTEANPTHTYLDGLISSGDLREVANIVPGTLKSVTEAPEVTDIINAEDDAVDFSVLSKSEVKKYEFNTRNLKPDNLVLAFGGEVSNGIWKAPMEAYNGKEVSVLIKGRAVAGKKQWLWFPRVKMTAERTEEFAKDEANSLKFKFTVLQPTDTSDNKFSNEFRFFRAIEPTNAKHDTTNDTLAWTYIDGFDEASDYEYSEDGGTTWVTCTSNPQSVTSGVSTSSLRLRAKAYISSDMSEAQWLESASVTPEAV